METPLSYDPAEDPFKSARLQMVSEQLKSRGIRDHRVLSAMSKVPRHLFVSPSLRGHAYADCALTLSEGQTISQPYMVAYMTEAVLQDNTGRVLEIGTGSGYQAAVFAEIAREVYTVEVRQGLARDAQRRLSGLGYKNIRFFVGNGASALPEGVSFEGIVVTAAPGRIPEALLEKLDIGGRLVLPLGDGGQHLHVVTKKEDSIEDDRRFAVRFVPFLEPGEENGTREGNGWLAL